MSERVCMDELVMSDTDEGILTYRPWLRTDKTRKRGHQCRMVGKIEREERKR